MTTENPWGPRVDIGGKVDFTMMYVAHDAFTRDIELLSTWVGPAWTWSPAAQQRWEKFKEQLHIHHAVEDSSLWPLLREAASGAGEIEVLEEMELEHAAIDPALAQIDQVILARDPAGLTDGMTTMAASLGAHMRHEENAALPLTEARLGPEGWAKFTGQIRETIGLRDAPGYFPWLLEGAPTATVSKVLAILPPPARLMYRAVWAPSYRRTVKSAAA